MISNNRHTLSPPRPASWLYNPFPTLLPVVLSRICDVVPLLPVAPGDRRQTTVGRVWIGTMDPQPLRPTARRCARTLDLGTAPREHRRRAPTAYGASRGREHGTCDRTVAMAMACPMASCPGYSIACVAAAPSGGEAGLDASAIASVTFSASARACLAAGRVPALGGRSSEASRTPLLTNLASNRSRESMEPSQSLSDVRTAFEAAAVAITLSRPCTKGPATSSRVEKSRTTPPKRMFANLQPLRRPADPPAAFGFSPGEGKALVKSMSPTTDSASSNKSSSSAAAGGASKAGMMPNFARMRFSRDSERPLSSQSHWTFQRLLELLDGVIPEGRDGEDASLAAARGHLLQACL